MGERDASKVQLDFPQLTADLISVLRLTGTLGLLGLSDVVVPVVNVANIRPTDVTIAPVDYDSAEIFNGDVIGPGANAVILDSGARAAGIYDVFMGCSMLSSAITSSLRFEWRNAANAANLAVWPTIISGAAVVANSLPIGPFGVNLGLNERIRLLSLTANAGRVAGWLMMALRPTP